jgi:hypothetical protein
MSAKTTDSKTSAKARDPDLAKAEIAMQRTAQKAKDKARRIGTSIVVVKDGDIVEERPKRDGRNPEMTRQGILTLQTGDTIPAGVVQRGRPLTRDKWSPLWDILSFCQKLLFDSLFRLGDADCLRAGE